VRSIRLILIAAALAACSKNSTATESPSQSGSGSAHSNQVLHWGPAPAVLPPGAEIAVLEGDPSKTEPFTVRLRLPNGYKIPPHTHPTTENVTVISGTFLAGMGGQFVDTQMQSLEVGDFASIPGNHAHYAMARGTTVVQVHALGPFALTYVNPADTPKAR
jgi:quercetin dioxygenase-like cupin family protein